MLGCSRTLIIQMPKVCVFCGHRPQSKTNEHVLPKWLIEMTGDPKREVSFGTYWHIKQKRPTVPAFDQFHFPACYVCNTRFSDLEGRTSKVLTNSGGVFAPDLAGCFLHEIEWLVKCMLNPRLANHRTARGRSASREPCRVPNLAGSSSA